MNATNSSLGYYTDDENMAIINNLNHRKSVLLSPAIAYTSVLMVIGILGNPIAIYIYGWHWQKTTTRNFLLCIAVVDLVNCVITMPTEIAVMMNFYHFDNGHVCRMSRFTTYVMNNATSFILVVVAIDRYIRICRPHQQPITPKGALISCGVAALVGVAVSWPALVLYGRVEVMFPFKGRLVYGVMCQVNSKYAKTSYPFAFFIYFWVAVAITSAIIIAMYILIGKEILKRKKMKKERNRSMETVMKKYRNASNSAEHDVFLPQTPTLERNNQASTLPIGQTATPPDSSSQTPPLTASLSPNPTSANRRFTFSKDKAVSLVNAVWGKSIKFRGGQSTLMLFAITVLYVLSFLPFLIVVTIRTAVGVTFYPGLSPANEVVVNIFLRSYLINNCANPIVYGLCNTQFRKECKKLCMCMVRKQQIPLSRGDLNKPNTGSGRSNISEH